MFKGYVPSGVVPDDSASDDCVAGRENSVVERKQDRSVVIREIDTDAVCFLPGGCGLDQRTVSAAHAFKGLTPSEPEIKSIHAVSP